MLVAYAGPKSPAAALGRNIGICHIGIYRYLSVYSVAALRNLRWNSATSVSSISLELGAGS